MVRTYRNTAFLAWLALYNKERVKLSLPPATEQEARDAYEVGESPETAAQYAAGA